jgi:transcriptional regulator with XRE-family HTH domain
MAQTKSPTPIRAVLSKNLRQLRATQGVSQERLAEICGLHRTYIGSVERGERNISLDNLERIATAFQTTVAALLSADAS